MVSCLGAGNPKNVIVLLLLGFPSTRMVPCSGAGNPGARFRHQQCLQRWTDQLWSLIHLRQAEHYCLCFVGWSEGESSQVPTKNKCGAEDGRTVY